MECNKEYTLRQLREGIKYHLYANTNKHFSVLLSRMVKRGLINRISSGVFIKPEKPKTLTTEIEIKNQTKLF